MRFCFTLTVFPSFCIQMMSKTKVIPTIRAEVQTLQVTTETLVENSGPKTEDLVAAVKKQMEKQMETVYHRLNVLENMGDLYTDFAGGDLEGGEEGEEDEENRKKISPILPPKNVSFTTMSMLMTNFLDLCLYVCL